MRMNLAEVLSSDGHELPFEVSQNMDSFDFNGSEYRLPEPVLIKGKLANVCGDVGIKATIKGSLATDCARCGRDVRHPFNIEISDKIVQGEEEDGITLSGTYIDLSEIASVAIITEIPIQILCDENCRGICSKCGSNLNIVECGCGEDAAGPLWDMIKNLNWKDEV